MLIVAGIGFRAAAADRRERIARALLVSGLVGFVLALGAQGPTAGAFRFLFDHVPGFRIMREPEKFEALLALAYAGLFGLGLRSLFTTSSGRRGRAIVAVAVLALPCAYTFPMLWGFGGYARPSEIPSSWSQAESLMGSGSGKVLALPGDAYLPFAWTQQRSVASPMSAFFSREVLIDGRLDLGGLESQTSDARSRYLRFITDSGPMLTRFGNLIAPLDVRYVVLAKTSDWLRYSWLEDQTDLRLVHAWPDLELFENLEPVSTAYAPEHSVRVQDWGEVVGLADRAQLTDLAVTVNRAAPGPIRTPGVSIPPNGGRPLTVETSSPVGYDVKSEGEGWLALTQPFDPSWHLNGRAPVANLGITDLFRGPIPPGTAEIRYGRWPLVRTCYLLSAIAILVSLIAIGLALRSRNRPANVPIESEAR
jgi:hypothetical protein